jgi:hypothetical protein
MPDDDWWEDHAQFMDWVSQDRMGRFVVDNFLSRTRPPPDEEEWRDIEGAVNYIKEHMGASKGVALVLLSSGCGSELVRSRWSSYGEPKYHTDAYNPLTGADWIGANIYPEKSKIYNPQQHRRGTLTNVCINIPDLDCWLQNRLSAGPSAPAAAKDLVDPAVQAQRHDSVKPGISGGKRGRKSKGKELYLAEFERLYGNKAHLPPVPEIADQLAKWLAKHPDVKQQPSIQTIQNRLWEKLRNNTAVRD